MKKLILVTGCMIQLVIGIQLSVVGQSREISFTQEDRDRLIQIEEKLNSQQKQIDLLKELFFWGFGIMISFMLFMLGFIIWDRKTAMEPLREQTRSLIYTLREYAKEQPKLAEILRIHGIL